MIIARMEWLNYHHLRYFWVVAKEGTIRQAAEKLSVSQPSISAQIHLLEKSLGAQLLKRSGRGLTLTDVGQMVFDYAEDIFSTGQDLMDAIGDRPGYRTMRCQVGVTDSVPKLVASRMLRPAFNLSQPVRMLCREGRLDTLLLELAGFRLDLVLADSYASRSLHVKTFNHALGHCSSVFCAVPRIADTLRRTFPQSLHGAPALLPAEPIPLRLALEEWFDSLKIRPVVVAEFEDPAFMTVMAAEGLGIIAIPSVIEHETVKRYGLKVFGRTDKCLHQYYAITAERRLRHPAVIAITDHSRKDLLN